MSPVEPLCQVQAAPKGPGGSGVGAAQLCSRVVGEENFTMKGSLLKTSVPQGSQPSS